MKFPVNSLLAGNLAFSETSSPVNFSGQGDRSGGLATPNMRMTALSRLLGPVAGNPATISGGAFDQAGISPTPVATD
jgi:hypothetical protein